MRGFFETNTLSTFLCCQQAGLAMVKQPEGGSIITFGDWATTRPYKNYAAYFPSKGAIPTLTRCLAVALGPEITVNCVAPGLVEGTRMAKRIPDEVVDDIRRRLLLAHPALADDIAAQVVAFCRADSVTGQVLTIDGGYV